ncbi:hemicentin-1-like [Conger conger]|uniref:hemicentin-1-like n=1 Tax=Conger conger TaxID=82655 RepID=UPI002A5A3C63|nr:hemicentin-1-like [Conger conger]
MLLFILIGAFSVAGAGSEELLVEAGSLAVLPCTIKSPTKGSPSVQWVKINGRDRNTVWRRERSGMEFQGVEVAPRARCPHSDFGKGVFNLHIERVRVEDGGEYTCTTTDRRKEVQRHVLRVIQVSVSPAAPLEGSSVNVTCSVTPRPAEATVSWKLNGSPLSLQQTRSTANMEERQIMSMSPRETGQWTCTVRLGKKEGEATQYLSMRGISSPLAEVTQLYRAVGSPVVLPCVFSEGLTPQNAGWQRNLNGAGPFRPLPPTLQPSGPQRDLSVRMERVEAGDGGTYRCFGEVAGRKLQRQLLLVTAQVRSSSPVKLNAPVSLTCELSNGTGVTGYEWLQITYDANGTRTETPKCQTKTLRIPKMTEQHTGEWVCRYRGEQGILGNVTYSFQVMSHLEAERPSSGKAGMVTGVGFLIVVLLLIVLQMYKNYRRRKMILQYPALETIVHSASNAREGRERERMREKAQGSQPQA